MVAVVSAYCAITVMDSIEYIIQLKWFRLTSWLELSSSGHLPDP